MTDLKTILTDWKESLQSNKNKAGFTLIELLIVIVVIGILVLLAIPMFLGRTDKAHETNIKNDIKVTEQKMAELLVDHQDTAMEDWEKVTTPNEGNLYGRGGPINRIPVDEYWLIDKEFIKEEIGSLLDGEFYTNGEGNVFYSTDASIESDPSANDKEITHYNTLNDVLVEYDVVSYSTNNIEYNQPLDIKYIGEEDHKFFKGTNERNYLYGEDKADVVSLRDFLHITHPNVIQTRIDSGLLVKINPTDWYMSTRDMYEQYSHIAYPIPYPDEAGEYYDFFYPLENLEYNSLTSKSHVLTTTSYVKYNHYLSGKSNEIPEENDIIQLFLLHDDVDNIGVKIVEYAFENEIDEIPLSLPSVTTSLGEKNNDGSQGVVHSGIVYFNKNKVSEIMIGSKKHYIFTVTFEDLLALIDQLEK